MKVLFADTVHPILWDGLKSHGYQCVEGYHLSKIEIQNTIADYHGLVIRSRFHIDASFLDACNNLQFIARSGSGLENIDVASAEKKGIHCLNAPEGNAQAVAEHALGMLLALFNKLNTADQEVRNGIWKREENRGQELSGKTAGIIGYGNNGSALAKVLQGFDCRVLAYDKYRKGFGNEWVEEVNMDTLFLETEVLSLHIPLTEETHHLFNNNYLQQFKKPIYLINTARGKCVDTSTVLDGLNSGQLLGACLDVFEFEKNSFEQLEQMPDALQKLTQSKNVILSPHVAGWTQESYRKLSDVLLAKILAL